MSEQERQADENGREEGGNTRDSRCRGEPRDDGVQVAPSGAGAPERRRDDDGRTKAERSYMAFLKSQEKTRSVARRRGRREGEVGTGQRNRVREEGEGGMATWFPSARLHAYVRAHVRTNCRERLFTVPRKQMRTHARAHACVYDARPRFRARSACARSAKSTIVT